MLTEIKATKKATPYWLPLVVVVLGSFTAMLNNSSLNVALPRMMDIFGVTVDQIQWVLTAFMLTSGVVIPVTGFLGDTLGLKKVFILSLCIFTAGSVFCALAWNNNSMVAARIVQGIGGGAIMPVSMAIVYSIVPRDKMGMALGFWGMSAIAAPAIGPVLGGYVVDHINWRFLFIMNIPVGILAIVTGSLLLPENSRKTVSRFDFRGFVTSALGCFTLLLALSQGHRAGWSSFYIVFLLTASGVLLLAFIILELSSPEPMLDLRLLNNKVFTASIAGGCLVSIGLFGGIFLIPIFAQNLMNKSPMETGLMLMPAAIVSGVMMPVGGALFDRYGPRAVTFIGLVILAWGTWEFKNLSMYSTALFVTIMASVRSFGMGLAMMPMTTAGMNSVPPDMVGRASSLANMLRQIAASMGIAVLTTIMQSRQSFYLEGLADSAAGASSLAEMECMVLAINNTFIAAALFVIMGIPAALFLGKVRPDARRNDAAGGKVYSEKEGITHA